MPLRIVFGAMCFDWFDGIVGNWFLKVSGHLAD